VLGFLPLFPDNILRKKKRERVSTISSTQCHGCIRRGKIINPTKATH
jgi:hypothetical protein